MHAIEKLMASAAGLPSVACGELINCRVDIAGINDLYLQTIMSFFEMGGDKVANPENVVVFFDHYAPASSIKQADNQKKFRAFCATQGIGKLMDINEGVCHQTLVDHGLSAPGKLIVVTDSHTTTHGALGAFGTGVGATDLAVALRTGELWFKVPAMLRINLTGQLQKGVYAKDIILHIIGSLGADYALYMGVEFAGPLLASLSIAERMVLCNMTTEMGAKLAYIQPDTATISFLKEKGITDYTVYTTDADYVYAKELSVCVDDIEPQLAVPYSVDNVKPLVQYVGKPIDQAFLGTCTGGRIEDLAIAAKILRGKHIAKGVRLLVVPASQDVLRQAIRLGYMESLLAAGASFVTPGCAACLGTHQGILAEGETCISTSNRNFPGRMGHKRAQIFLASPASVAAAALEGCISDPRTYL